MSVTTWQLVPPPTDREFGLLQALIHREAGIFLAPYKKALLHARLSRRIRELGLTSFDAYHRLVSRPEQRAELRVLLDLISTHETSFFREPAHFEFLRKIVLPGLKAAHTAGQHDQSVRAWSAGCSTGEEPYSIAMTLLEQLPPQRGWRIDVLGTDIGDAELAQARHATWPITSAAQIPDACLRRYMLRGIGSQAGQLKVSTAVRSVVRFEYLNLLTDTPQGAAFDLIFCRNVMIYFSAEVKQRVMAMLLGRLAPGGYFFLGHAENLGPGYPGLRAISPNIYRAG